MALMPMCPSVELRIVALATPWWASNRGEHTMVIKQILTEVRAENTPIRSIINAVGLAAIDEGYIKRSVYSQLVRAHLHRLSGSTGSGIHTVPGQHGVFYGDISAIAQADETHVGAHRDLLRR